MKSPSHTHQGTLLHLSQFTFPLILSIILIVFISAKPAQGVLTTCYDPSGGERTDSPCFPDATSSACCATGWICTNTSLCLAGPTVTLNPGDSVFFEGTCSDPTWNSPGCPSFCRSAELAKNPDNAVFNCGNGNYCCSAPEFSGTSACCSNSSVVFFLGNFVNETTIGGAVGPGYSSTTSSSTSSVSASTTTASTTADTTTTGSHGTVASTASNTAGAQSTATIQAQNNTGSSGLSTGAKAGIAIGAVLGATALAVFAFLIYRQHKSTKLLKDKLDEMQSQSQQTPEWVAHQAVREAFAPKAPNADVRHELGGGGKMAELPGRLM